MEACHGLFIVFKKGGIRIYLRVAPLPDYQVNGSCIEVLVEFRTPRAGDAVHRPEHLFYLLKLNDFIFFQHVPRGKGYVILRMPVLSGYYLVEAGRYPVYDGNYGIPVRNGEGPAGAKIVLHVDNE